MLVLVVLNAGLFVETSTVATDVLLALQFDGRAVREGEVWRVLTANMVHFNRAHFFLDVGVFLVLGLLYERSFARSYPWLLLVLCVASGVSTLLYRSEATILRGLSGVDTGLFAAALCVEFKFAWRDRARWLWVAPAAAIFVAKNAFELATGQSFFSTESLLGPAKLATEAHAAAIAAAVTFCACASGLRRWCTAA